MSRTPAVTSKDFWAGLWIWPIWSGIDWMHRKWHCDTRWYCVTLVERGFTSFFASYPDSEPDTFWETIAWIGVTWDSMYHPPESDSWRSLVGSGGIPSTQGECRGLLDIVTVLWNGAIIRFPRDWQYLVAPHYYFAPLWVRTPRFPPFSGIHSLIKLGRSTYASSFFVKMIHLICEWPT